MTQEDRNNFISLQAKVETIERDIKETKENSQNLNNEFGKLMFHLVGDKTTNTKGIIEDFRAVKVRLSRVEKFYVAVAGVVGFIIAYITKKFL